MAELVHQSEIGKSAIGADVVADRAEARDARVDGDVNVGAGAARMHPADRDALHIGGEHPRAAGRTAGLIGLTVDDEVGRRRVGCGRELDIGDGRPQRQPRQPPALFLGAPIRRGVEPIGDIAAGRPGWRQGQAAELDHIGQVVAVGGRIGVAGVLPGAVADRGDRGVSRHAGEKGDGRVPGIRERGGRHGHASLFAGGPTNRSRPPSQCATPGSGARACRARVRSHDFIRAAIEMQNSRSGTGHRGGVLAAR